MCLTRIVSQDEWTNMTLSSEILRKLKILLWKDPGTEELLKALSHENKICPLVTLWRQMIENKHSSRSNAIS